MGNALGLELARVPEDECDFRMRERWGFWPKRLPTADSESLPTVLVAAMPPYVREGEIVLGARYVFPGDGSQLFSRTQFCGQHLRERSREPGCVLTL